MLISALRTKLRIAKLLCATKPIQHQSSNHYPLNSFLCRGYAKRKIPHVDNSNTRARAVRIPTVNTPVNTEQQSKPRIDPFEEREIEWRGSRVPRKLLFRVTYRGIGEYYPTGVTWTIHGKRVPAPFYGQEPVLLEMLENQYGNTWLGSGKPTYAMQMMNPGAGKTRLLSEWIMQAFAKPNVIKDFLKQGDVKRRKQFLNVLYWSAYKQHTIINDFDYWIPERDDPSHWLKTANKVIIETIVQRHDGQSINFKGRQIDINKSSSENYFGLNGDTELLIELFLALADSTYEDPKTLPFPSIGLPDKQSFVFFSIDECHLPVNTNRNEHNREDSLFLMFRSVAAKLKLMNFNGITPFWFAVATKLPGKFLDMHGGPLFFVGTKSLKPLLQIKYLAQICKEFLQWKLPEPYYKSSSILRQFSEFAAVHLIRNYLKTLCNPKAVELFVQAALPYRDVIVPALDDSFSQELDVLFPSELPLQGNQEDIERLEIGAALCQEMDYDGIIPGLQVSVKALVSKGFLSIWKRDQINAMSPAKFFITRPFFKLDFSKLTKQLKLLECKPEVAKSSYWHDESISLASLVLDNDVSRILTSSYMGSDFQKAVACTLYARYKLIKKDTVRLKEIFPEHLPDDLKNATVTLNGVVRLENQFRLETKDVLDAIVKNNVIAICDYSEVWMPICVQGSRRSIMSFQCDRYLRKPSLTQQVKNWKKNLNRGFYFVYFTDLKPKTYSKDEFIRHYENKEKLKGYVSVAEAEDVVSPLYLAAGDFGPKTEQSYKLIKLKKPRVTNDQ